MAAVMIGIDPHKASHTAVAISVAEERLGELQVRASVAQARRLLAWAAAWPERTWAIEGAEGLGHLLAQQLLAAGERVLDVPPKLAARVRLLASGDTNKNGPNDARSVAVAALRSPARRPVAADDHAAVLKVWSKRHRDLGRTRTQVACRLHVVLCELVPGGVSKRITAGQATQVLASITPQNAVEAARCELAAAFTGDLARIDAQMRGTRKILAAVVAAAGTTVTEVFGVGPVIAATIIAAARDVSRFPGRDHFAAYNGTAPIEVPSGKRKIYRLSRRGNRRLNHAIHMAAVSQVSHHHSAGRAYSGQETSRRQDPQRGPALPETADQRRHLRAPPSRRPPRGSQREEPGRATGEPLCLQGGRLTPRTPALRTSHSRAWPPPYDRGRCTAPGWAFPGRCHSAAGEAAGPGGAPAAQRGRTTWRCREATAILGYGEGQHHRPPVTSPIHHPNATKRPAQPLDAKRHSICVDDGLSAVIS